MKLMLAEQVETLGGPCYKFKTDEPVALKDGWKYAVRLMRKLSEVGKISGISCDSEYANEMDFSDIGCYLCKTVDEVESLIDTFLKEGTYSCSFQVWAGKACASVGVGIFDPYMGVFVSEIEGDKLATKIAKIVSGMKVL